ncbi:hypothetical protein [Stenotrophomonas sp.]|uniref:hypothetical protein n=1 Tax=Stenotrophomonas sp. TaxID=69392 RepID=UPI0028A6608E|nr:hypothetical protein [Stenotrophomonas sp.]
MSPRQVLLDLLERLDARDPDHLPVVPLAAYFEGNDFEECIAPNQWGYGRPPIAELYARFAAIAAKPEVEGVYVGLHQDWGSALEDDSEWPAAENVHLLTHADAATVEGWLQGLECDGVGEGWPYGQHIDAPVPSEGHRVLTVFWD